MKFKMKAGDLNLPDQINQVTVTPFEKYLIFIEIIHDEFSENPLKAFDGMGEIYSFSQRHINYMDPGAVMSLPGAVPLSYFEHGNCLWFVAGDPTPPGVEFQWDGVRYAGVWAPDKECLESNPHPAGTEETTAWLRKQARQACELYTAWCNGECYGYRIWAVEKVGDYDDPDDYGNKDNIWEDDCWGYYGWDGVISAVKGVFG